MHKTWEFKFKNYGRIKLDYRKIYNQNNSISILSKENFQDRLKRIKPKRKIKGHSSKWKKNTKLSWKNSKKTMTVMPKP